jgi:5'-phosphate synthase pdxT subunit
VLAIQGGYAAHASALTDAGAEPVLVRSPEELAALDGLILPGGESTTMLKFLERGGFLATLKTFAETTPTFGTCAGCILLANEVTSPAQRSFAVLDITVERNAYGRQNDSVILNEETALPGGPLEMVFIRAPRIARLGPGIEVLATRNGGPDKPADPTLVRSGRILAATFHPELTEDTRVHQYFLDIVKDVTPS